MWKRRGRNTVINPVLRQNATIGVTQGQIYLFMPFQKTWELRMRRGDVYFKSVDHRFCCSEHFCPTDFKAGLTGQRRDSFFERAPEKVSLREDRLKIRTENIFHAQREEAKHSMEKMLQDQEESLPDCKTVKFSGPPTH